MANNFCPLLSKEVCLPECKKCKDRPCEDFLLAILGDCNNIDELDLLNKKVLKALNGRQAVITSNKLLDSPGYAISTSNNFEFIYSAAPNKEFGKIPEMVLRYKQSAVIFTDKETSERFIEELKKELENLHIKRQIPLRIFNLKKEASQ